MLRQNAEFSVLNLLVHILTTKPQKIKKTSRLTVPMTTASCYEQLKKKTIKIFSSTQVIKIAKQ